MGTPREPILADLPKDFLNYVKEYMIRSNSQSYIKKLSNDKYEIYCRECMTKEKVNYKTVRYAKITGLCPFCFKEIGKFHRNKYRSYFYDYWLQDMKIDGKHVGYEYILNKSPDETEPKFTYYQVAYWDKSPKGKEQFYARYINAYMSTIVFNLNDDEWRQRKSHNPYRLENRFEFWDINSDYDFGGFRKRRSYREYVEQMLSDVVYTLSDMTYKSNQMELIKNNIFNEGMLCAIKIFDLKTADEVYKYKNYIAENKNHMRIRVNTPFNLNVYYLDYLSRNNIRYIDYYDYLCDLKTLGLKPDKPKDFRFRSEAIGELAEEKKDKRFNGQIKRRYKVLSNNIFKKKNIEIKPIKDVDEIYYVAKSLHNCMARMYLKDYAKGHTDLYCLWLNNKPLIAIEVLNGDLVQVRADHNEVPESKYKRIVNKWHKGLNYGTA